MFDHVLLVATTWMAMQEEAAACTRRVLDEVHLTALAQRFPHELSSGQTQLFGIALTFARPFDVLILDEPKQRLDAEHLETVTRVLAARRDAGATLAIATHSPVLADRLADRTLVLESAL